MGIMYNANDLLYSTVISIPKNTRGDMSQSDNYRGISMCNCICKLFDENVLNNYRPVSNLAFISKITEKVVASRLNHHLMVNNLK